MTITHTLPIFFAAALLVSAGCQQLSERSPHSAADLNLGVQAWTYNNLTLAETLDKTSALGLRYVQAFTRQKIGGGIEGSMTPSMDEGTRAKVLALAKAKGVTITSIGVVSATNETEWRELFGFAKAMGLRDIAVEPPKAKWPTELPLLDRLSREFGVGVTFHNHYNPENPPEHLLAALQPYGKHMGFCADTGHWARSGIEPVAALRTVESRLLALHFKDIIQFSRTARDVPWGTGVSNAAGQFAELRRQRFTGIIYLEYEARTPQIEAEIARCVQYFRLATQASDADLIAGRVVPPGFTADASELWKKKS
ncbi:MAG: hypothetical protein RIQ93_1869 [Verrucomicrobiota bacterium]|jgi:sugar phosphate isomerase/epimerase